MKAEIKHRSNSNQISRTTIVIGVEVDSGVEVEMEGSQYYFKVGQ